MPKTENRPTEPAAKSAGTDLGEFESTAYGPPWDGPNGMQGSGITSRGTKLPESPGSQQDFWIIAGDPTILTYGKWYHVQPNPFGRTGPFKMDDTGGAFQGGKKKVDFLVLEGREKQNAWGRRPVRVTEADGPDSETEATGDGEAQTTKVPYKFAVEKDEDYWSAITRLADEVNFRAFSRNGVFTYIADSRLAKREIKAKIDRESPYVVSDLVFAMDRGLPVTEATISVKARRYSLSPGDRVQVKGYGPADGDWLVQEIARSLFSDINDLTLRLEEPTLPEPANETKESDSGTTGVEGELVEGTLKDLSGTPQEIIEKYVVPLAKKHGMSTGASAASVAAANSAHSVSTTSGNRSAHKGPGHVAYASDMSNGSAPTPEMDALARDIATLFGISWSGSGLVNHTSGKYSFQLIYRTNEGGNHFNHVHIGIKVS